LTKEDLSYNNHAFWYHYIFSFRGSDDEKEMNLYEVIEDLIMISDFTPDYKIWYDQFYPKKEANEEGLFEMPQALSGQLTDRLQFAIESHLSEITFFINDNYIGEISGHFKAWFITWDELLAFKKYEKLFLLLLPMTGIEKTQRQEAEFQISEELKNIPVFKKHSHYLSKCIVNGLISDEFIQKTDVGTITTQLHSMRNIAYDEVAKINRALLSLFK